MRVKVEFIKEESESELSALVETQHRRGDTFSIHRGEHLMNGDIATYTLPASGRLVINMPTSTEKPIYDRDQAAAIMPSAQRQGDEGADRPDLQEIRTTKQRELEEIDRQLAERKARDEEQARADAEAQRQAQDDEAAKTRAAVEAKNRNETVAPAASPLPGQRTPPQGGQPLNKPTTATAPVANKTAGSTTIDASKAPNPSTNSQPSSSSGASSGGNTEKK